MLHLSFYIILKPSTTFCFLSTFFIIPFVPIYFLSMPLFFVAEVWWEWKLGEAEPDHHTIHYIACLYLYDHSCNSWR